MKIYQISFNFNQIIETLAAVLRIGEFFTPKISTELLYYDLYTGLV